MAQAAEPQPRAPTQLPSRPGRAAPGADSNHMLEEELCKSLRGPWGPAFLGLSQAIFPA